MADSIVIIVLTFGIFLFVVSYLALSHAENGPIAPINAQIDSGLLTVDSVENFNLALGLWKTAPIFFCIGLILWIFERSKGSDIAASTFFEYEVLLIVSLFISMLLVWAWGLSIDSIFGALDSNRMMSDISFQFDRSKVIAICQKLAYVGILIPRLVGSLLFMIHPIIRQKDNNFWDFEDEGSDSEESMTSYTFQQF